MCSELKIRVLENPLPFILGGGLGLAGVFYLRGKYRNRRERNELTARRLDRQATREEQLYFLSDKYKFGPEHDAIVSLPFTELVEKLQRRELKARQVLEAFVAKSIVITKQFNCITEFVPNMFELADKLDALPSVKGLLHGVPICLKEDHDIIGMDTTLGYSKYLDRPATDNCAMLQVLEGAGAVPFCKTNVPQTMFSIASVNPIFGTTTNHLNKLLGPGGSSSGTGCLVGAGGAPFGMGSDIGGSLRIPSHFSGVFTLRSTIGRFSGKGITQCVNSAGVVGVSGVIAPRANSLATVYKILTTNAIQNEVDPLTVPIPWNQMVYESKEPLRIGYFTSLPYFPSLGDTPQVILNAKRALEAMGHTVVKFELPDTWYIMKVYATLIGADGGAQIYKKLKNDEISYASEKFVQGTTLLSKLCSILHSLVNNKKTSRSFVGDPAALNSEVLWEYLLKQRALKYEVVQRMKDLNVDLIISPAYPFPAIPLKEVEELLPAAVYTCTWNLLDFPAGIVPFGQESGRNVDSYDDEGDHILRLAKECIKSSTGMPIGVQIIGKPFHEEKVLRVLTQLDEYKLANNN